MAPSNVQCCLNLADEVGRAEASQDGRTRPEGKRLQSHGKDMEHDAEWGTLESFDHKVTRSDQTHH